MSFDIARIDQRVRSMQQARYDRDSSMDIVRLARSGNIDRLHPELFADDIPKSTVANIIDTAARDTAEMVAPLPSLACTSGNMSTDADRKRAAKKNKIGSYYWKCSKLPIQNISFADSTVAYSFGTYIVEPDFERKMPRIRFESSFGAYYFKNRWGDVVWYAKIKDTTAGDLAATFSDKAEQILTYGAKQRREMNEHVRMVRYIGPEGHIVYLPDCENLVLAHAPNVLSRLPIAIAERPDTEDVPRGQYDDAVYPFMAAALMAQYKLSAAEQSVNAPWAFPDDVTELPYGAGAALRSQNPQQIGRVNLSLPPDVFRMTDELDRNVKEGARYPEARTGGIKGNIVTGRGVQELMGTMDTLLRTMQTVIKQALEDVTSICFEMDAKLWPNEQKKIEGLLTGKPFELTYTPSRDIGDSWGCEVTYGFAAGQSPAQAMVALLQLRGDDQISRDTARRQLPFDIDPEQEQREVDTQQLEDSLKQGLSALLQSMGPMVMQGQNPTQLLQTAAKAIEAVRQGTPLYRAVLEAFPEPEPAPQPGPEGAVPGAPGEPGAPEGAPPELPPGIRDNGLPAGVAYGQQGMAPGGMPSIQSLMSSLRGQGPPRMEAATLVKRPTG